MPIQYYRFLMKTLIQYWADSTPKCNEVVNVKETLNKSSFPPYRPGLHRGDSRPVSTPLAKSITCAGRGPRPLPGVAIYLAWAAIYLAWVAIYLAGMATYLARVAIYSAAPYDDL